MENRFELTERYKKQFKKWLQSLEFLKSNPCDSSMQYINICLCVCVCNCWMCFFLVVFKLSHTSSFVPVTK